MLSVNYGFVGAMMLLAAISLNGCIGSMILGVKFTNQTYNNFKHQNNVEANNTTNVENEDTSDDKSALLNNDDYCSFTEDAHLDNSTSLYLSRDRSTKFFNIDNTDSSDDEDGLIKNETHFKRHRKLFYNKLFLPFLLSHISYACANIISIAYFPALVIENGSTVAEAVIFQSLTGVSSSISRLAIGYIANLSIFSKHRRVLVSCFEGLVSLSMLMATFSSDFNILVLISIIGGVGAGSFSQLPTTTSDIVPSLFSEGLSTIRMVESVGAVIVLFCTGIYKNYIQLNLDFFN